MGFVWDSITLKFTVTTAKQAKVREHAPSLLKEARRGRDWVSRDSLRSFAGATTSLLLALPLPLPYTRSLHDVLADFTEVTKPAARAGARVRLSGGNGRRAKKDFLEWSKLGNGGRVFFEEELQWAIHTDAAELGRGGTGGPDEGLERRASALTLVSDLLKVKKQHITLRKLRAVTLGLGRVHVDPRS